MYLKIEKPRAQETYPSLAPAQLSRIMESIWSSMSDKDKEPFVEEACRFNASAAQEWDAKEGERDAERRRLCRTFGIPTSCSWHELTAHSEGRGRYAEEERVHGQWQQKQKQGQKRQRPDSKDVLSAPPLPSSSSSSSSSSAATASGAAVPRSASPSARAPSPSPSAAAGRKGARASRSFEGRKSAKRMRKALRAAPSGSDPWAQCWQPVRRQAAITRAVDRIFQMAQKHDNFALFGNDVIQCFYDLATVSTDPVRARCLKYVEQLAHRWKFNTATRGWKAGARATPQEVIDAVIGMYCLERLGIHHKLKAEVLACICSGDGGDGEDSGGGGGGGGGGGEGGGGGDGEGGGEGASGEAGDGAAAAAAAAAKPPPPPAPRVFGVVDYLKWDPRAADRPPNDIVDQCGVTISRYRALSNALIYTFYANRVGVVLGEPYEAFFEHVDALRPYGGPRELGEQAYVDQCYLITHIVFTLTNWGELRLEPELLPHEYYFVREHLAVCLSRADVHLVGEFVEVLRAFGADDADPLVRQGTAFLLAAQDKDGRWDSGRDKDEYTCYHATMVAAQALLHHHYRGFGPGIPEVTPILLRWHEAELRAARAERAALRPRAVGAVGGGKNGSSGGDSGGSGASGGGNSRALTAAASKSTEGKGKGKGKGQGKPPVADVERIVKMLEPLRSESLCGHKQPPPAAAVTAACAALDPLSTIEWTYALLEATGAVQVLKAVRDRCKDRMLASGAKTLVKSWKKQFKDRAKGRTPTPEPNE
eukprot:g2838.t1